MYLLRKISTSKQLFVQRLDEDEEDEDETVEEEQEQVQQQYIDVTHDKQYNSNNNNPEISVQCLEYAYEAAILEKEQEKEQEHEKEQEEQLQQSEESLDIQFDLMHYKENVRYLRHTPSNSSLDLQLEQQQQQQQQQLQLREVVATTMPTKQRATCSVSVGSKFDGNYHNVIIMEQPPNDDYPIVKWDINGNSLDEEHFDLRQHWDAFDNRWRQLQSLQAKRLGSGHSHSQKSSHHSSSCTLETWIDDAELGLCDESQNLLQTNNNNCNQCLKSF
ncbi:UPF0746 protein DDB_G0281095 isoform X2 [Drosophila innubila]|uniref:UPF0746 protein DDB_G0281095 isoform X2 n=1 Tax=Drosophila innubila TaxID=198719 RepID=UPI00148D4204|nr:UPF0746 protein DDB_G0281095 isoform X2 [Drosophila innubila]